MSTTIVHSSSGPLVGAPVGLSRRWATTSDVAGAAGIPPMRARRLLEQMRHRGIVQRTRRGDGGPLLWRLTPDVPARKAVR